MANMIHFNNSRGFNWELASGSLVVSIDEVFKQGHGRATYIYGSGEAIIKYSGNPRGSDIWEYYSKLSSRSGFLTPAKAFEDYMTQKPFLVARSHLKGIIELCKEFSRSLKSETFSLLNSAILQMREELNTLEITSAFHFNNGHLSYFPLGAPYLRRDVFNKPLAFNLRAGINEVLALANIPSLQDIASEESTKELSAHCESVEFISDVLSRSLKTIEEALDNTFESEAKAESSFSTSDQEVEFAKSLIMQHNPGLFGPGKEPVIVSATPLSGASVEEVLGRALSRFPDKTP